MVSQCAFRTARKGGVSARAKGAAVGRLLGDGLAKI